jgi:hypothetical protein
VRLGHVQAIRIECGERVEASRADAGDGERIEDMDRAEAVAGAAGDAGIFALGVDTDQRAIGGEQVGGTP